MPPRTTSTFAAQSSSGSVNRRGTACLNCRRRKIKCDTQKPVCGPCVRTSATDLCEYNEGEPCRTRILEGTIATLQARISALENTADAVPFNDSAELEAQFSGSMEIDMSAPITLSNEISTLPLVAETAFKEPPDFIIRILLHQFLHHASELGFFLNEPRFRESLLIRSPLGDPARPTPALVGAVYLWGVHLSTSELISSHEPAFLNEAVQLYATTLSTDHPRKVLHAIQAAVLLASYFFHTGRILEGKLHAGTAASLVFSNHYHELASFRSTDSVPRLASLDPVEEGECMNALWTVFLLNNKWSGAVGYPTSFPYSNPSACITIPWPLMMTSYEEGDRAAMSGTNTRPIVNDYLSGVPDNASSILTVLVKASTVFERSSHVFAQSPRIGTPDVAHTTSTAFVLLDNLTKTLQNALPGPEAVLNLPHVDSRAFLAAHGLSYAATIQLHSRFARINPPSEVACISSALTISQWTTVVVGSSFTYIAPIMAMVWSIAGQVLMEASAIAKARRAEPGIEFTIIDPDELIGAIERIATIMAKFAPYSALMRYQFIKLQESFAGSMIS